MECPARGAAPRRPDRKGDGHGGQTEQKGRHSSGECQNGPPSAHPKPQLLGQHHGLSHRTSAPGIAGFVEVFGQRQQPRVLYQF